MINEKVKYPLIGRVYDHYKGGKYEVLTLGKHSETDETMVVYKSLLFGSVHIRPLIMWFELVDSNTTEGLNIERFKLESEADSLDRIRFT